jgi:hypothetical protein
MLGEKDGIVTLAAAQVDRTAGRQRTVGHQLH